MSARGKIGRLNAETRHAVNLMIRDNAPAEIIIAHLRKQAGIDVSTQNISAWKRFGYRDWQRRQDRLEAMHARRAFARDLVQDASEEGDNALSIASDAAAAMAVDAITEALEEFEPSDLQIMLSEKPERFSSLISSLSELRKGDQAAIKLRMQVREYRRRIEALAAEARKRSRAGGGPDLAEIADAMDRILSGG